MFKLYFEDSGLVYVLAYTLTPPPLLPPRPPHAPFLYFLIYFLLLLAPLCHCQISPVCSFLSSPPLPPFLPLFLLHTLFSLSVSLFCDCSAWSPCGTPCRVPNLFIISALCRDVRGMLKYTPPRSGYKWAGVPPSALARPNCPADTATGMDRPYNLRTQTQTLKIITTSTEKTARRCEKTRGREGG